MRDNIDDGRIRRRGFLKSSTIAVTGTGVGLAGCIGESNENDGGEYPTQDIRYIIPYSSGGGFDAYSRALAEFLPEHLPNNVDVRVENMPGAGGRTGANEVYRAEPDGYTLGIFNVPGMITTQLIQDTEYDLEKVSWLGRLASNQYVLTVNPDSGYRTLEDLQSADEVTFSDTDYSATSALVAIIATNVMDINAEFVMGYEGSTEAVTGAIRGDTTAHMATMSNARTAVQNDELRPIISLTEEPPEWAPDIPTVMEEGYEEALIGLQRPVGGPPGMDEETIEILDTAIENTVHSEQMQEWSEEADRPLNHLTAAETDEFIKNNIETFMEYQGLLKEYLES